MNNNNNNQNITETILMYFIFLIIVLLLIAIGIQYFNNTHQPIQQYVYQIEPSKPNIYISSPLANYESNPYYYHYHYGYPRRSYKYAYYNNRGRRRW